MKLLFLALLLLATPALAFDPFAEVGIDRREGVAVPLDRPFADAAGRAVTLASLGAGRPIVLVPVLHHCPNICGVTLAGLAQAIAAQGYRAGDDFALVAFGIDPAETPADAMDDVTTLEAAFPALAGHVSAVTGTAEDVAAVTDALGYRYGYDERIGEIAHAAAVAVLTPDGRLARWLYGLTPDPTDLRLAITEAGEGRIGGITDQLLLLCYHYDPVTGRYGSLVWTLLRVGGSATALALAGFIGVAVLRERRAGGPA